MTLKNGIGLSFLLLVGWLLVVFLFCFVLVWFGLGWGGGLMIIFTIKASMVVSMDVVMVIIVGMIMMLTMVVMTLMTVKR